MAGLVAGVGVLAAYSWTGPVPFFVALAVLEVTIAPVAWSLLTELGHTVTGVVLRIAPVASLIALALIGLVQAVGGWIFLVGGLVLITSPLLQGWTSGRIRTSLVEQLSPRTETRRRFDEIVAHGFGGPDDDLPAR
jgi:hypothetical protein